MEIITTIEEMRRYAQRMKSEGRRTGFVPTMGALHEGHLSLVNEALKQCDIVIMSIFINRLQFNDPDDYSSYPKTVEDDLKKAENSQAACVFLPDDTTMYNNQKTYIDMEELTDHLCGSSRPGHFRGVFTVVAKLFNIIQPDCAVFGQKDIQQARSIEKMVCDLNIPVEIIMAPIIREESGLAMSSRNVHLSDDEKKRALSLYNALQLADTLIQEGHTETAGIVKAMRRLIESEGKPDRIDYIETVDYEKLRPISTIEKPCVIAIAAFFGTTRLIDNILIK